MEAFVERAGLALIAGAAWFVASGPAAAQLYFRPFAYTYSYDYPIEEEEPARYASRRAVASILAREGFRLVGPLGRRGEQVVATGFNRSEGEVRFIIDPYAGRIIRGMHMGPPPPLERGPARENDVPTIGGSRPIVRELDRDAPPRSERPQREHRIVRQEAPEPREPREERLPRPRSVAPSTPVTRPAAPPAKRARASRPDAPATSARPPGSPPDATTPAPAPSEATPAADPGKPSPRVVYPLPSKPTPSLSAPAEPLRSTNATVAAKPSAATPGNPTASHATSHSSGGGSHRAIVPPASATTPAPSTSVQ